MTKLLVYCIMTLVMLSLVLMVKEVEGLTSYGEETVRKGNKSVVSLIIIDSFVIVEYFPSSLRSFFFRKFWSKSLTVEFVFR